LIVLDLSLHFIPFGGHNGKSIEELSIFFLPFLGRLPVSSLLFYFLKDSPVNSRTTSGEFTGEILREDS